jgi:hypothetical protein
MHALVSLSTLDGAASKVSLELANVQQSRIEPSLGQELGRGSVMGSSCLNGEAAFLCCAASSCVHAALLMGLGIASWGSLP